MVINYVIYYVLSKQERSDKVFHGSGAEFALLNIKLVYLIL